MSNELINAYEALSERLKAASVVAPFQFVDDLDLSVVLRTEDLPCVRMFPERLGSVVDRGVGGRAGEEIVVLVRLREDYDFKMYNEDRSRGLLWLAQKVANAIDGGDMAAGGAWGAAPRWEAVNFIPEALGAQMDLRVFLTTARFTRGSL